MTEEALLVGVVICCLVILVSFPVACSFILFSSEITSVEEGLKELKDLNIWTIHVLSVRCLNSVSSIICSKWLRPIYGE